MGLTGFSKLLVVASLIGGWQSQAQASANCGAQLTHENPTLLAAATILNSFEYVRHALNQASSEVQNPVYCLSGLALSRNIYQNVRYYLEIDVKEASTNETKFSFRYLYQDASVQAYHNVQGQPWTGLEQSSTKSVLNAIVANAKFTPLAGVKRLENPLEAATHSATYLAAQGSVEAQTLNVIEIQSEGSSVYLVGWMPRATGNPFAKIDAPKGLLLKLGANGEVLVSENVSLVSDLLFPLESVFSATGSSLPGRENWPSAFVELAR